MRQLNALTLGILYWCLKDSGQPEYPLPAFPGWSLWNPLYSAPDEEFIEPKILGRVADQTVLTTRGISLTAGQNVSAGGDAPNESAVVVEEVLRRLRYVSRQFSMPQECVAMRTHDRVGDLKRLEAASRGESMTTLRSYIKPTALTERHIEDVAALNAGFSLPVHADVLLDALEAHAIGDFRKALLYAAIAVETFAFGQLEEAAAAAIPSADVRHRVITLAVDAHTNVQKDPISKLVLEGENFSRLLHEAPLYILGRSLLVEQPDTYQKALRLYTTRNKIAHLGVQPVDPKYFPATTEGSKEALDAAVDVIGWFGDAGPYFVWDRKFTPL